MPTFEAMRSQLLNNKNPLTTEAAFDAWETDFKTLSAGWAESEEIKTDLYLRYLAQREEVLRESEQQRVNSEDEDLELGMSMSISSQEERVRGMTPPNDTQVEPFDDLNVVMNYDAPQLKAAFETLQATYPGCRRIRADGNCYYRSVMYGVIEQAIASPERPILFEQLAQRIALRVGAYEGEYDAELMALSSIFREARDGLRWNTLQDLEEDMRNPASKTDTLMVRAARVLTAHELEASLGQSGFIEESDVDHILTFGEDAEGAAVETSVLFNALGVSGELVRVEMAEGSQQGTQDTRKREPLQDDLDPPIEVNILLKPGHYDLLYSNEQYAAIQQFQVQPVLEVEQALVDSVMPHQEPDVPEEKEQLLLQDVVDDLQHNPVNIDTSMGLFLNEVEAHSERALDMLLNAVDVLNDMRSSVDSFQDHTERDSVLERIQVQGDVLHKKMDSLLNSARSHQASMKETLMNGRSLHDSSERQLEEEERELESTLVELNEREDITPNEAWSEACHALSDCSPYVAADEGTRGHRAFKYEAEDSEGNTIENIVSEKEQMELDELYAKKLDAEFRPGK